MAEPTPRLFAENDVALDWQPPSSTLVQNWYFRRSVGLLEIGAIDTVDTSDLDSIRTEVCP
jgi:hypothetical protein